MNWTRFFAPALVASLAVNAWLAFRPRPHDAPVAARPAVRCSALERCRAAAAQVTGLRLPLGGGERARAPRPTEPPASSAKADAESAAKERRDADRPADFDHLLCAVATEAAREKWMREREDLVKNLRRSLADPDEQRKNAEKVGAEFSDAVGATGKGRDALMAEYAELRKARMEEALDALEDDPVDFDALREAAAGLFRDEDDLVARRGGTAALERAREQMQKGRFGILAIASTYAGIPWEDGVTW